MLPIPHNGKQRGELRMERRKKAIGTFTLVCCLPALFVLPGLSTYPMATIAGICVAMLGITMPADGVPNVGVPEKDRLKAVSCPAGV
jgi:hypothetical protein